MLALKLKSNQNYQKKKKKKIQAFTSVTQNQTCKPQQFKVRWKMLALELKMNLFQCGLEGNRRHIHFEL